MEGNNTLKSVFLILFSIMLAAPLPADDTIYQAEDQNDIVRGKIILPVNALARQNSYTVLIELNISNGWHINSHQPLEEFLIPTEISFTSMPGISFGKTDFQKPELRSFAFSETEMSVFEGKAYAKTTITITPDFTDQELVLRGIIYFQACNDQSCLAPAEAEMTKLVNIIEAGTETTPVNQALFEQILPRFATEDLETDESALYHTLQKSGLIYILFFIYLGGLALNLTPCVYPLIPITISYFGGQSQGQRGALVIRAIVYVIGMAITYSVVGVAAALTGGLLGSALQNPMVLIFIALVLIALALSMFGLYEIRIPQSLAMIGGKNRSGYIGTLLMGLTVGLIAAPCIGPFVLGLLTYVSDKGDPLFGFLLFFVLALGLGTPFLLLGIFSGAATSLPRSGAWMVWVRNLFGFILIGMAIYFLEPLFPSKTSYFYALALLSVITGIYLGWIDKNTGQIFFKVMRKAIGILAVLFGIFLVMPGDSNAGEGIDWQIYSTEILKKAHGENKPILLDFYADWCIPCKELDKFTFSDRRVVTATGKMVAIKVDLTSFEANETKPLRSQFDIKGVPTIVFLSAGGSELRSLRLTGFEDADKFLSRLGKVSNN